MRLSRIFTVLLLPFILTGCLRIEGDIKTFSDARVTGTLEYGVNKALIQATGETWTLEKLKNSEEAKDAKSICANGLWTENSQEFVMTCNLANSQLTDPDLYFKIIDEKIVFHFAQNLDADDNTVELGTLRMNVSFPGEITSIKENRSGFVTKIGTNQIAIKAPGTVKVDVTVTSACGLACGTPSTSEPVGTNGKPYVSAPKKLSGIISENLRFTKTNSPYTITATLQIPKDLSVLVDEGVEIIYDGPRYAKSSASVKYSDDVMFYVHGNLEFKGTDSSPIKLSGKPLNYFSLSGAKEGCNVLVNGVVFNGGGGLHQGTSYGYFSLKNSMVIDVKNYQYIWYPTKPLIIEGNIFKNSGGMSIGFDGRKSSERPQTPQVTVRNNLFIGPSTTGYWVENWVAYGSTMNVTANSFTEGPYVAVGVQKGSDSAFLDASGNYWGTTDQSKIKDMVMDSKDSLDYLSEIKTNNPLANSPVTALESKAAVYFAANAVSETVAKANDSTKAIQDKIAASANKNPQKVVSSSKEATIKCQKGNSLLKVIGIKPICPSGYKKIK